MDRNEIYEKQYMVEFDIPIPFPEEMLAMIVDQREAFDVLFHRGRLLSYCLSVDRSRLWAIFVASSESELLSLIDELPMTPYMDFDYEELMVYTSVSMLPTMSLN